MAKETDGTGACYRVGRLNQMDQSYSRDYCRYALHDPIVLCIAKQYFFSSENSFKKTFEEIQNQCFFELLIL